MRFFNKAPVRIGLPVLAAVAVAVGASGASAAPGSSGGVAAAGKGHENEWVGTWAASPQAPSAAISPMSVTGFTNQTVRNVVYASTGGNRVRVLFSNAYGQRPLVIGSASVADNLVGAEVVPATLRALTFAGERSVSIPVGHEMVSDPVSLRVPARQDLVVSVFLPNSTGPATYHQEGQQDNFVSTSGDFAQDPAATAYTTTTTSWFFVDGVDVIPTDRAVGGSVVAFGDSITDGATVGVNSNERWPNILGDRLAAVHGPTLSAVDEGIGGNRVLNDSTCFGESALKRFSRDVVAQSAVRDVIILEGVNDLGFSQLDPTSPTGPCAVPNTNVSAWQIIAGYKELIAAAHTSGLRIFGATITPFKDSFYWNAAAEQKRATINSWIHTSGAFDGVVDFASVIASPYDHNVMNPIYDSGDHLHPNDAGYVAMGNAVNLHKILDR
jgi:lysophospholipase L1-like esterase